jgi:hypothetical protein
VRASASPSTPGGRRHLESVGGSGGAVAGIGGGVGSKGGKVGLSKKTAFPKSGLSGRC